MKKFLRLFITTIFSFVFISQLMASEVVTDIQTVDKLVSQIKQGGHVLYMRHGPTQPKTADTNKQSADGKFSVDFEDCSSQRNLSDEGRDVVNDIKGHMQRLNIPISKVSSSPYCRALHTAQIIFDDVTIDYDLAYSLSKKSAESKRLGEYLKTRILNVKNDQANDVFVGHSTNLREGLGVWPKPEGVVVVFKHQAGNLIYKGMIKPKDWQLVP